MNQLDDEMNKKLIIKNKIEITNRLNKKNVNYEDKNLSKSLNKNLNSLSSNEAKNSIKNGLSNSLDNNLINNLDNLDDLNNLNKLNKLNKMTIDNQLCNDYTYFNGNLNNNDNELNNLNVSSKQIKSTSFESNLTDEFNSEHSTDCINGDSSSNLGDDEFDKQANEMDELLDKKSIKDQKIVEVVSFIFQYARILEQQTIRQIKIIRFLKHELI